MNLNKYLYVSIPLILLVYLGVLAMFVVCSVSPKLERDKKVTQLNQCISTVIQEDAKLQDSYAMWAFEFCKFKVSQGE